MNIQNRNYQRVNCWSRKEKSLLLSALYKHGSKNIEMLKKIVSTKSEFEIQKRINMYKRLSGNSKMKKRGFIDGSDELGTRKKSRYAVWPDDVNLNYWTCAIANATGNKSFKTLMPIALRIIAHLENRSHSKIDSSVDLKQLYLYLADVIDEKVLGTVNPSSREFLINCIMKFNLEVKTGVSCETRNFLENITRIFPDISKPMISGLTPESQALNELSSSIVYNPLQIPETFLKTKNQ